LITFVCKLTATFSLAVIKIELVRTKERMRARTSVRKVHEVPGAIPDLMYHHLAPEDGNTEGLRIEELVGDAHQLRRVHQQDRTASRVELPLPFEDDAWSGGYRRDAPAAPQEGRRQNE
jgi:hypothetical protein